MDLDSFKTKYKRLIDIGVIEISDSLEFVYIDRFDEETKTFLVEATELTAPRNHINKCGYRKWFGIGCYRKIKT
jgi:hypothetical protein